MEYRRLGRSGLQVSALSLGSWLTFGKQISDDVAEELGVCYRTARKAIRSSGVVLRDPSARLRGRTSPKRKKAGNE